MRQFDREYAERPQRAAATPSPAPSPLVAAASAHGNAAVARVLRPQATSLRPQILPFDPARWLGGAVDGVMDWLGDLVPGTETPIAPGTPDAPAADQPAAPAAPAAPVQDELSVLMAKDRLTPEEVDRARDLIEQIPDEARRGELFLRLQEKVEYHSQRDNESTENGAAIGDVMCNLTSLAMCLEYLGVPNPYPDMQFEDALERVRVEKGLGARTTADGWGGVATALGVEWGFVEGAGTNTRDWYETNVLSHLSGGEAVMLSIDGHICRLQGMNDQGLIADDPYGESTLGAGAERGWDDTNSKDEGSTTGEDHVWPWADVERHAMKWIAWFRGAVD